MDIACKECGLEVSYEGTTFAISADFHRLCKFRPEAESPTGCPKLEEELEKRTGRIPSRRSRGLP
jgi:hypothetical protein